MTHHNPRLGGDPLHFPGGLIDSNELWKILVARRHVKAYIHGHVHDRTNAVHQGIHIINTPATSYVASTKLSTTGWTLARLTPQGISLTTRTTDEKHPWNGGRQTAHLANLIPRLPKTRSLQRKATPGKFFRGSRFLSG